MGKKNVFKKLVSLILSLVLTGVVIYGSLQGNLFPQDNTIDKSHDVRFDAREPVESCGDDQGEVGFPLPPVPEML